MTENGISSGSTGFKVFKCFSGSTGFQVLPLDSLEGLLDEETGFDESLYDQTVCDDTVGIRSTLCWTVCLTFCTDDKTMLFLKLIRKFMHQQLQNECKNFMSREMS